MPTGLPHVNIASLNKLSHKAAHATKAAVSSGFSSAATAVASRAGTVDESMRVTHEKLASLHSTYSELHSSLKHQALNARKTARTMREPNGPMLQLTSLLGQDARRGVQTAMSVDAAIARCWEEYANHLEKELLAPAKQECGAIFAEGDSIWSSYIAMVNELAARQGKERLLGGGAHLHELAERKSAHESSQLPRLAALVQAAEAAMSYLVDRHRLLHAAVHRDAHGAAQAAAGDTPGGTDDTPSLLAATRAGWQKLQAASSAVAGGAARASVAGGVAAPPPRGVFGAPLESLALRTDAVHGVPQVAHALLVRLLTGGASAAAGAGADVGSGSFVDTEGLFRIQADEAECDALRRSLDGGAAAAAHAVAAATDPHVLATTLKQWLRRLPQPLVPAAVYRALVQLGQQVAAAAPAARGAGLAPPLEAALPALMRSLPQPNLLSLHALLELLEAVARREATNKMGAANLALVFAPTICRSEGALSAPAAGGGLELAVEIPAVSRVLAELITHRASCFPPLPALASPAATDATAAGGGAAAAQPSSAGATDARERRSSASADPPNWWYSAGGEQKGPVSGARLAAMLAGGEISLSTWVFEGGSSDWQELSQAQARLPQISTVW